MMLESSFGAYKVCSDGTLGVGGITAAFKAGALRDRLAETLGAGGTIVVKVNPPRD